MNVASALVDTALTWWQCLYITKKYLRTWSDAKILMRKFFVDTSSEPMSSCDEHSLEEELSTVPPIASNIFAEN